MDMWWLAAGSVILRHEVPLIAESNAVVLRQQYTELFPVEG